VVRQPVKSPGFIFGSALWGAYKNF